MEHQQAALRKAIAAMSAFTDQEGNMPADTGEFRDLKQALSDCEAALLTMPDDALNKDDRQCCGKCDTPAMCDEFGCPKPADSLCGKGEKPDGEQTPTADDCLDVIRYLSSSLKAADLLNAVLLHKLGGSVTLVDADGEAVIGKNVVSIADHASKAITFRLDDAPAVQVQ